MAKGGAIGRVEAILGVVGVLALGVTYSIATGWNPLPAAQAWLDKHRTLAEPAPAWTVKVAEEPSGAGVAAGTVVVTAGGAATGYALADGRSLWTREAGWSAVAGAGTGAVVVAGKPGHGYDVLNPTTGAPRWTDPSAIGAWTFSDLVIGLACPQSVVCILTARAPDSGTLRWQVSLPGNARPLSGANHTLVGIRPMSRTERGPLPVPALLGFPVNDEVQVIDTGAGTRVRTYRSGPMSWATVAATRVVVTSGNFRSGTCHLRTEGRDPAGDRQVWQRDGYDLHTGTELGCDQRTNPLGGGGLITARNPEGRDVLLDPATGQEAYRAGTGEKIIDTDGQLVLVRTADKGTVRAVDLGNGHTLWIRKADRSVGVALGHGVAVFTDSAAGKLTVLSATGQVLADVISSATVLGYADSGLLVTDGRQVGLVPYRGSPGR